MIKKAVFLDKDGTLIVDKPYNINPEFVILEDGVIEGLMLLQKMDYQLIIVSNQPGISMGLFTKSQLDDLINYMTKLLERCGIKLNGFYYCPHPAEKKTGSFVCECRKPQPGLLLRAATDLNVDLNASWMIGDILNDVEAGNLAGCRSVLIDNGNETEWRKTEIRMPIYTAQNFLSAALYISNKT